MSRQSFSDVVPEPEGNLKAAIGYLALTDLVNKDLDGLVTRSVGNEDQSFQPARKASCFSNPRFDLLFSQLVSLFVRSLHCAPQYTPARSVGRP